MSDEDALNKKYINQKIHPVFETIILDLLIDKPDDVIDFLKTWLENKGERLKQKLQNSNAKPKKEDMPDSESDDDEVEEIKPIKNPKAKGRQSISAEAFGQFNQKKAYVPKVIPKTGEQVKRIKTRLSQAFMFQALNEKEQNIVIDAMEEFKFKPNDWVIKQGQEGDYLYVVDTGSLDCVKMFKPDQGEPTYLKTYVPGESFGELALLYNAPRAASIQAKTESVLFGLDRECFNGIVKEAAMKNRNRFEMFFKKVEILESLNDQERSQLIDAIVIENYKAGEYVITQGDNERTNFFYLVEEGQLVALKSFSQGDQPQEVMKYQSGDYFGELSLIKDQPRQASILCKTNCSIIALSRYQFKRLMGPIEDILKRNQTKYSKYA